MDIKTGEIYENCEEETIKELEELNKTLITPLDSLEFAAMKQIPQDERPSDLAWMRYSQFKNLGDITITEAFCDGFKQARKIYEKTACNGGNKCENILKL